MQPLRKVSDQGSRCRDMDRLQLECNSDLKKNLIDIMSRIVNSMLTHLETVNGISIEESQLIKDSPTDKGRSLCLLSTLGGHQNGYQQLLECLENDGHSQLIARLNQELNIDSDDATIRINKLQTGLRSCIINDVENIRKNWIDYLEVYDLDSIFLPLEVKECCFEKIRGTIMDNEFLTSNESARIFMVEGDPGMGKTTWVNKIAKDWAIDIVKPGVPIQFDHVFLVPLNNLSPKPSLTTVLNAIAERTECPIKEISRNLKNKRSLLILDGYDENPCPDLMKSIATKSSWLSKIVVTTRSSHVDDLKEDRHCWLRICGFTVDNAKLFFRKQKRVFPESPDLIKICQIPLYAAIVCSLHDEQLINIVKLASVQVQLIDAFIEEIYRLIKKKSHLTVLRLEFEEALFNAGQIAFDQTFGQTFGSATVKRLLNMNVAPCSEAAQSLCIQLGLISCAAQRNRERNSRLKTVSFPHKTIEEYLMAKWFCKTIEADRSLLKRYKQFGSEYWFRSSFFLHCMDVLNEEHFLMSLQEGEVSCNRPLENYVETMRKDSFKMRSFWFKHVCFSASSVKFALLILTKGIHIVRFDECIFPIDIEDFTNNIEKFGLHVGEIDLVKCHYPPKLLQLLIRKTKCIEVSLDGEQNCSLPACLMCMAGCDAIDTAPFDLCGGMCELLILHGDGTTVSILPILKHTQGTFPKLYVMSDQLISADSAMFQYFVKINYKYCSLNFRQLTPLNDSATERIEVDLASVPQPSSFAALLLCVRTLHEVLFTNFSENPSESICNFNSGDGCWWTELWKLLADYRGKCDIKFKYPGAEPKGGFRCAHGEPRQSPKGITIAGRNKFGFKRDFSLPASF